ncbi:MAG: PfkB family carbohydrate kinase [Terracidiphilus sp.]
MTTSEILTALPRLSALVVGDVCLDRWCRYDPRFAEASRETGIPRMAVVEFERTPGAAGTVASNLRALGVGRVAVLGVVGDDGHAYELEIALRERSIDASALVHDPAGLTFTYTKLINRETGVEDMPRVDYISARQMAPEVEASVLERFHRLAPQADVLIISDQMEVDAGGVVTSALRAAIERFAASDSNRIVWVDSRARGELFSRTLVKLNEEEARQACARIGIAVDYEALRRHIGHSTLIVTRGAQDTLVVTADGTAIVPARRVNAIDICGAGDSFNAGAAMVLKLTGDPVAAARFGNLVASITVTKPGTGTATPGEVLDAAASWGALS